MICFVFVFSFRTVDTQGAVAELFITVRLCDCNGNHGACDFEHLKTGYNSSMTFQLVQCVCTQYYAGRVQRLQVIDLHVILGVYCGSYFLERLQCVL